MNVVADCPFCTLNPERIVSDDDLVIVIRDGYPVSPGHTLIIPKRHVKSIFEATAAEREALLQALDEEKSVLDKEFSPAAYNIGINDGLAAGQTVPHLHIHLIPRFEGDCDDPRGGVRWIFPDKARYWRD
ncbi:HIT family protein [Thioalkalivibrio denitrificans]|uniref:HIT family protein n=2 Tax=Thioalkalivibrio denitrificans TaxID=108003 RepID=A0A1V3NS64_9GAMM|nr:HIT family protein [Thioalkalivibrio denitrificans]